MKKEKSLKKKSELTGTTTREKMLARKKKLESRGSSSGLVFPKEGTLRVRLKSPGDDKELGIEVVRFYIPGVGGIISPATFDEPCPFMEKYQELKNSSDPDDKELAKKFVPSRRYVVGGIVYADDKGKQVDYDGKDKGVLIPSSVYQDIVDLYLDEDDAGDMTDPINGYDIKIIRSGSGKMDTTYSARNCNKSKLDKQYRGTIDLEKIVRDNIKSYDELATDLATYLNESHDDEEEVKPKNKKLKDKKKRRFKSDI